MPKCRKEKPAFEDLGLTTMDRGQNETNGPLHEYFLTLATATQHFSPNLQSSSRQIPELYFIDDTFSSSFPLSKGAYNHTTQEICHHNIK